MVEKIKEYLKDHITWILALITAYLYLCAFEYEVAYLSKFGVSNTFSELDNNALLGDGLKVVEMIIASLSLRYLLNVSIKFVLSKIGISKNVIEGVSFMAFLSIIIVSFGPFDVEYLYYILSILGVIVIISAALNAILWLIAIFKRQQFNINASENQNQSSETFNLRLYHIVVFLSVFSFVICRLLGEGEAHHKKAFDIIKQDTVSYIVIRKYGESFLCRNIDLQTRTLGKITTFLKVPDSGLSMVRHENLGPLFSAAIVQKDTAVLVNGEVIRVRKPTSGNSLMKLLQLVFSNE